jgi:IS30 family transposase
MARRYKRLTFTDRQAIEKCLLEGYSPKELAEKIGIHIATIYRELARGGNPYSAITAQKKIGS